MANVIVDAGTDAKIAKLRRSGMEFIDLAILEPVEVWAEKPRFAKTSPSLTPEPSTPTASTASLSSGSLAPHTPIAPRGQLPQQHHLAPPQLGDPALSKKGVPEDAAKRNIFGKMFKKSKDVTPPVSPALSSTFNIKYKAQGADSTPTPGRTTGRGHARNLSASLRPMSSSSRNRSSSPNPLAKFGLLVPGQEEGNVSTSDLSIGGSSDDKPLLPPVLGIQPTLSYCYLSSGIAGAPGPPPVPQTSKPPRALMHVWFVKKWLKRRADSHDTGGLLGVMQMHASRRGSILSTSSSGSLGPLEEGVEVRFEWKRATSKGKTRGKGRERGKEERRGREDADSPEDVKALRRFSALSRHSVSTNFSVSEDGGGKSRPGTPMREGRRERGGSFSSPGQDKDPGEYDEDSDPEDSETPWVCTLKVRRTGVGAGSRDDREYASSTNGSVRNSRKSKGASATETGQQEYDEYGVPLPEPQVLRIKVGTLSPTPHHPKIVAMLKVPFPLPDLEVERIGISRRPLGGGVFPLFTHKCSKLMLSCCEGYTNSRPPPSQWEGTTLTAEEIKDVVCSTGLWLVVREGFGGVGRVSRKGDGWRIRG